MSKKVTQVGKKTQQTGFIAEFFSSKTMITIIVAILTTLMTQGVIAWREGIKANGEIKDVAIELYTDMSQSMESLNLTIGVDQGNNGNMVLKNPHTRLGNDFFNKLVKIKSKLTEEEFNSANKFYTNVMFLESIRQDYWKLTNQQAILSKGQEYSSALKLIKESCDMLNIDSVIKKIGDISK